MTPQDPPVGLPDPPCPEVGTRGQAISPATRHSPSPGMELLSHMTPRFLSPGPQVGARAYNRPYDRVAKNM